MLNFGSPETSTSNDCMASGVNSEEVGADTMRRRQAVRPPSFEAHFTPLDVTAQFTRHGSWIPLGTKQDLVHAPNDGIKLRVPYLHMREFAHFRGPYEKFKTDESKRRELLDRLSGVIARRTQNSFCRNIRVGDHEALNLEYPVRENIGPPLALAGLTCVGAANLWHQQYGDGKAIHYVFEDGDHDKQYLTEALQKYYKIGPAYRKKEDHVQFQPADWLAYEHRTLSCRWIHGNQHLQQKDYRRSMTLLYDRLPNENWGDIGVTEMLEFCMRLNISSRDELLAPNQEAERH